MTLNSPASREGRTEPDQHADTETVSGADMFGDLVALREKLAAMEHRRWANWQRWVHDCCVRNPDGSLTIPPDLVERWERQIATPYEELSEQEKESDRLQVAPYLPFILGDSRG